MRIFNAHSRYEHYDPQRKRGGWYKVGAAWITGTGGPCATAEDLS